MTAKKVKRSSIQLKWGHRIKKRNWREKFQREKQSNLTKMSAGTNYKINLKSKNKFISQKNKFK